MAKAVKLTKEQYEAIRKPIVSKHIACKPRNFTNLISAYTLNLSRNYTPTYRT